MGNSLKITQAQGRRLWLHAQRLDHPEPFGRGPEAVVNTVKHLGYVQIDTIHVIERCHHHILYNRIPSYHREDLEFAQSQQKSVFEYWTHALSYIPTEDYRFFSGGMKRMIRTHNAWWDVVKPAQVSRLLARIRQEGPVSIREIDDRVKVEKLHPWASSKPSKRVSEFAFYTGRLAIAERHGMLKKYELTDRHFGWPSSPPAAKPQEILDYQLDRGLRSQGVVSLDSLCHLEPSLKPRMERTIQKRVRSKQLLPVEIPGLEKIRFWIEPHNLELALPTPDDRSQILSPFDPLIIQRKRLHAFFNYEHRFEAYLPASKRVYGYFALPVLRGDKIVALLDLKTDRQAGKLLVQRWSWLPRERSKAQRQSIEEALDGFEGFQLGRGTAQRVMSENG